MSPELNLGNKEDNKEIQNLLTEAAKALHTKIDSEQSTQLLEKILNTGKLPDGQFFQFNRKRELKKLLHAPQKLNPKKDEVFLVFWSWGWDGTSGDEIVPMKVELVKFTGLKDKIFKVGAHLTKSVHLGKVYNNTSTLVVEEKLSDPKDSAIYPNSPVLLPLKRIG